MSNILFTGWVIYIHRIKHHPVTMRLHGIKKGVRQKVFLTRREAIFNHIQGTYFTWAQCYKMGWRVTKVNICLPIKEAKP